MAKRGKRQQSAAHRNWPEFGNGFKGAPNQAGRQGKVQVPQTVGPRCKPLLVNWNGSKSESSYPSHEYHLAAVLLSFSFVFFFRLLFVFVFYWRGHINFTLANGFYWQQTTPAGQFRPGQTTHIHTLTTLQCWAETGRAASAQSHSASSLRVQLPPIAAQPPSRSGSKRLNLENWYVIGFKAQNKCVSWLLGRPFHLWNEKGARHENNQRMEERENNKRRKSIFEEHAD